MPSALTPSARRQFSDVIPAGICAHPKIDPATGEMIAFCYNMQAPFLTWTVILPDGTGTPPRRVAGVDRPSMIHDLAITARYLVRVVSPLYFDVAPAVGGGLPRHRLLRHARCHGER